ncbi:SKP1-like protein 12 [Salvia splendens]|uniref:SKP1-like protein 12 n=1 Tax=Salvia splendens TaxID=180675 RepID=UPI001C26C542|nr:SKP1-like protein 12 [Salvia splendens]
MAKTVILVSSDGKWFEIAESMAAQSIVIGNVIEYVGGGDPIPLFNVTARVLIKVIPQESRRWKVLLECMKAANYLNIEGLFDLISQKIADSIEACKSEAEMVYDFSPERRRANTCACIGLV